MIGYFIDNTSSFLYRARYVFRNLSKMMGIDLKECEKGEYAREEFEAIIYYGSQADYLLQDKPYFFIQHVHFETLPSPITAVKAVDSPDLPDENIGLFKQASKVLEKTLYVDGTSKEPLISISRNQVFCSIDIIATCYYFFSMQNERYSARRDDFGRFQRNFSTLGEHIYNYPVIDRYVKLIRILLHFLVPRIERRPLWPKKYNFAVALSHDVDRIQTYTFKKMKRGIRYQKKISDSLKLPFRLLSSFFQIENWLGNFTFICELENQYRASSTFFFVARRRHKNDPFYNLTSIRIKRGINIIQNRGCRIGLHGTIPSATSSVFLMEEKARMEYHLSRQIKGIRQHYLCFNENTFTSWAASDFQYDSTLGFSNDTGYRCGTGFPFRLVVEKKELGVVEIPLILMDTVLFLESKKNLASERAWEIILWHLQETKRNNSLLTLNWHNSDLHPHDIYGYSQLYEEILKWTRENNGWLCSLDDVYEWWIQK